ncbi:GH39 family glycosyl hydrolase [Robertmurraya sp. P23]|uniref:GH39 family glycosyl hydrolase n=1 Tax=Robertmurraya sp. P23 TaxID=3436931 RepID=UPI003D96342F
MNTLQSLNSSKLMTISILNNKSSLEHAHSDIELIYLMKGKLNLKVDRESYQMNKLDLIIINSNQFHSFESEDDTLFVVIHFDSNELSNLLSKKTLQFNCNTVKYGHKNKELIIAIDELLTVYIKPNQFSHVHLLEKTLKVISLLTDNHLISNNDSENNRQAANKDQDDRLYEIMNYIQNNFRESITLEELASLHYLSIPYLSKFFKKQTGKTFLQHLNEVRLKHAVNDLINTKKTITRVALDNGFPTLSSFNRVFREYYELKPVDYRKSMEASLKLEKPPSNEDDNDKALIELRKYLNSGDIIQQENYSTPQKIVDTQIIKLNSLKNIKKYWNEVINIGYARDILNSDMQDQIIQLQKEIGFKYARFWGIFGDDMLVEDHSGEITTYNFTNTNKLLDFLVRNKLKPFIELGPKPKILAKSIEEIMVVQTVTEKSPEEWSNLARAFLLQSIERFGIEEVETWYFEIWRPHIDFVKHNGQEGKDFLKNLKKNQLQDASQFDEYYEMLSGFKGIANEIVPFAKVGGCGLSINLEGEKLDLLLQHWKQRSVHPDFLSVYLYPIEIDNAGSNIPLKNMQSANPDYIENKLSQIRKSLKKAGFDDLELNVTEWNITVSNRDFINDSSFKATYMIKNIVENITKNEVNMFGYWLFSDIFSDFRDSKHLLFGGAGLVTKSGIKKPSYHAFTLLNQLGDTLISRGSNFIVTKKSGERYQVLFYNYKHFDYSYYLNPEGSIDISEQYDIFENQDITNFSLEIQGIKNGRYRVKEIILNRNHGSVLDEWFKFGAVYDLKIDEMDYLKQICTPSIKVEHRTVENNLLNINGSLEPHEVRLMEFNLVYT